MKILVTFDASHDAQAALRYGIQKVGELGGELIALHVFPKHLFADYGAGSNAERAARRESVDRLEGALKVIRESGGDFRTRLVLVDGHPEETILDYAQSENVDLIVSPPRFDSLLGKACCLMDIVSEEEQTASEKSCRMTPVQCSRGWMGRAYS